MLLNYENWMEVVSAALGDKSNSEKVTIMLDLLDHAINHPWVDDEVRDSILSNIAREYKIPYSSMDDEEDED